MKAISCALSLVCSPAVALEINLLPQAGMHDHPEVLQAFQAAAQMWSEQLEDDAVINIRINYEPLRPGVLGSTRSEFVEFDVGEVLPDLSSAAEGAAEQADTVDMMINYTSDSPHGEGSEVPYLDDDDGQNNRRVRATRANAKALGVIEAEDPGVDASITFSDEFNWDFDPSDGIEENHFSFISTAAHEIGHALGFVSGVDILDSYSGVTPGRGPLSEDSLLVVYIGDLTRSSDLSSEHDADLDFTADQRVKLFSEDQSIEFSTGRSRGDGEQASHWKEGEGIGLMDPRLAPGEHSEIAENDLLYFAELGYEPVGDEAMALVNSESPASEEQQDALSVDLAQAELSDLPSSEEPSTTSVGEAPVVELEYVGSQIDAPGEPFSISVFANGTVRVYYPPYMKRAGVYEMQLSRERLEEVLLGVGAGLGAEVQEITSNDQATSGQVTASELPGEHTVQTRVTLDQEQALSLLRELGSSQEAVHQFEDQAEQGVEFFSLNAEADAAGGGVVTFDGSAFSAGIEQLESLSQDPALARISE